MLVLPPLNYRQSVTWSLPDVLDAIGSPRGRVTLSLTLKVVIFDLSGWTEAALLSGRRGGAPAAPMSWFLSREAMQRRWDGAPVARAGQWPGAGDLKLR